ncbi:MAG: VCBS repeat-containing protein, partial [Nitrospirae bacterium]|nr:VCBS repeat-containing protein [Nitrospirota bacterium]
MTRNEIMVRLLSHGYGPPSLVCKSVLFEGVMGPVDTPTRIKWGISTWFAVGLLLTALAASPRAWGAEELQPILLTGSATYSVPIVVPPGTNGIQPNLSLVYNSDMGNDAIGQGWDLAGLGYVERLGPNYSPAPTYFGNDTYRLNFGGGSYKLVSTGTDSSGTTTYRTEIDSHLRIQHFDDYWVVTDQGGTQYFFGQNFYSQQRTNQNSVTNQEEPFLWYLDQVIDAHQTSMTVEYNFLGALSQGSRRYRNHVREILYSQGPTLLCSPSSRANCRSVKFLYEGREDDLFDYRSGAETVTWNRLQAIEVKLGSQLVRKYVLGYDPSPVTARGLAPVSQLTSITEYGPGGANLLPPRKFAYHVDGNKDNLDLAAINMGNPPPFELSYCSLVADMNNDGLIDVVTTTISNDNPMYVQENQDGQSFKSQVSIPGQYPTFCPIEFVPVTINVPVTHTYTARDDYGQPMTHVVTGSGAQVDWIPVVTRAHDLVVLDFDGDGLPDLLYGHTAQSSGWGWWRNLGNNVFSPKQSVTNPPAFVLNEAGVRYADMDQDGLIDIVRLENLGGSDSTGTWTFKLSWWRNLGRDSSTNALQFSQTATILNNLQIYVTYPQGKGLTPFDQFAVFQANMMSILNLLDMNRDGMPDLVWPAVESLSSGTATMRYYYYPLNGRSAGALVTMSPGLVVETTVKYPFVELNRLADMNGDGWPDLLSGIPNNYSYYPGQGGNGTFGAKVTLGQSPSRYLTSSNDVNSFVNNMMLTDMNGDGFIDILQGDASAYRSYRMTMTDNHQKLETVTTPMGGFMTGAYQNLRDNGINKWVLRQITHNNGLGQSWAEDFSYAGAKRTYWPKNEFRGYRTVTATDPPDHNGLRHTTTTMFNQEDVKKGRVEKIEIAGAPAISGDPPPPFSATTYAYQETQNSPAQGVHQVNLTSETVVTYDGDAATSKTSQTTYANFDAYGHPRSVTKSGTGTASRIVTTSYLENADAYIVNRPASTVTTIGGVNVNATWFSYDDLAEGIKPSKGDVTQERYYLSGAPASDYPVVTHVYDYAGNLLGHIDAKENLCPITRPTGFWFGLYTTKIDYDDLFKAFQVAEYNALCQSMTMNYWGLNTTLTIPTTGPLAGAVAVPGLLATVADPNGVKTDTYYDDLGRPKGTVTPPDSTDAPTTLWSYTNFIDTDTDGNPATPLVRTPASTKQSRRESTSSTLDRYTYIDGFGRVVQTKREAENGQWITTDTFYNTRGLVESVSIPYLTAGSAYSQPDTTKPKTRTLYDVMRRPIEVQNPDHSTSSPNKRMIQYQDWVVTETNEKGIATVREFDALGRLIRVTEPSPGGTTLYRYDNVSSAGHTIQKITDAQNNVTTMWFDTLGRKVASSDPDMGGCGDLTVVAPANFS